MPYLKKLHIIFIALFAFALHIPLLYAAPNTFEVKPFDKVSIIDPSTTINTATIALKLYDSLKLSQKGLSQNAFVYAIKGYQYLHQKRIIESNKAITIIDFTKPSNSKRLFILDLKNYKILFNTYVAHGQGSGLLLPTIFSNIPESFQSSLGFYKTATTYLGKNGFSLKLLGLENGINDRAEERAIVIHGAPYVSDEIAQQQGHIGRSWGCPAVSEKLAKPIIEKIKNGSCLFIYSNDKKYLHKSKIIAG